MKAYYNDNDPAVAAWLRGLIRIGAIPDGDVDERSILEVEPSDLAGYEQCHFFAGIGGWAHALQLAGWPDGRPVWTASLPCQPFSNAGARKGKEDERHLVPAFSRLVAACQPPIIFGEQVASASVFGSAAKRAQRAGTGQPEWCWIDDLFAELEASRYACGARDVPAAGVGAPHIRQRCFWGAIRLADSDDAGPQGWGVRGNGASERAPRPGGVVDRLADSERLKRDGGGDSGAGRREELADYGSSSRLGQPDCAGPQPGRQSSESTRYRGAVDAAGGDGGVADADSAARRQVPRSAPCDEEENGGQGRNRGGSNGHHRFAGDGESGGVADPNGQTASAERQQRGGEQRQQSQDSEHGHICRGTGTAHGGWRDADWIFCRDGKWRPVEPSVQCLADGVSSPMVRGGAIVPASFTLAKKQERRVMRLRGYGNAIVPQAAAAFVQSFMKAAESI